MKKLIGSLLACALVLTGCGSNSGNGEGLTVYRDYETTNREIQSFNYLTTYQATDSQVLSNFVDGLVEHDNKGNLLNALAEDYTHNENYDVWTFTLRDGLKWVDRDGNEVADVTAHDFVSAIKYGLTASNLSSNVSMITAFLAGAQEYYDATDAGTATDEMFENVGIKAIDDKTIEYTLVGPRPYFPTVLTYACYNPMPTDFVAEIGEDQFGTSPDTILYNGCYRMGEYTQFSYKTYVKNESYWDKENVPFEEVQVTILESSSRAWEMFQTGELDRATLTQDQVVTEMDNNNENLVETPAGKFSYVIWFNFQEEGNPDWNAAVANENFRKAFFYGVDLSDFRARINAMNPDKLINNAYTASGLVSTSDGTDYTKLEELSEYTGEGATIYQPEKAAEYRAKAIEELTAAGVSLPVTVHYPYKSGDQTSEETLAIVKSSFENSVGSDLIKIEGVSYVTSAQSEIYAQNRQSIMISGWGADYGDPYNFLSQLTAEGTMNTNYIHYVDEELDAMVEEANQILENDDRYHAFAAVEDYVLDKAYVIPAYVSGYEVEVTKINDFSKPNAKYGNASQKIKFWESQTEAYTQEEWAALEAEYNAK